VLPEADCHIIIMSKSSKCVSWIFTVSTSSVIICPYVTTVIDSNTYNALTTSNMYLLLHPKLQDKRCIDSGSEAIHKPTTPTYFHASMTSTRSSYYQDPICLDISHRITPYHGVLITNSVSIK